MKNWFVTGASKGFGRAFVRAALERGDAVAAAARDTAPLADLAERHGERLVPLVLDVTDRGAARDAVATAHERLGRLDVVVNNAGYGGVDPAPGSSSRGREPCATGSTAGTRPAPSPPCEVIGTPPASTRSEFVGAAPEPPGPPVRVRS